MTPASRPFTRLVIALLVLSQIASGCTSLRPLSVTPPPQPIEASIPAGSRVVVVMISGERLKGEVVSTAETGLSLRTKSRIARNHHSLDPSGVRGVAPRNVDGGMVETTREIAFTEMQSLQVRRLSKGRTTAAAVGGVLLVAAGTVAVLFLRAMAEGDE